MQLLNSINVDRQLLGLKALRGTSDSAMAERVSAVGWQPTATSHTPPVQYSGSSP